MLSDQPVGVMYQKPARKEGRVPIRALPNGWAFDTDASL